MASQKPVADTLADRFAKAQNKGKKKAEREARGAAGSYGTRSKGAADSSSDEEVFQSPAGSSAEEAVAFGRRSKLSRTPPPVLPNPAGATGAVPRTPLPALPPRSVVLIPPVRPPSRGSQSSGPSRPGSPAAQHAVRVPRPVPQRAGIVVTGGFEAAGRAGDLLAGFDNDDDDVFEEETAAPADPEQQGPIARDAEGSGEAESPPQNIAGAVAPPPVAPPALQAPPVVAIGHVLPAAAGGAMAALPVVPAGAADGRRAVVRAERYLNHYVDRLADAVHDEHSVELVRNRKAAAVKSRDEFKKALDELISTIDDPAVVAADADRNTLVTALFDYGVGVEGPAEQRVTEADEYINEATEAAKAKKNTKLPDQTVTPFDGTVTEWPRFQAEFDSLVGSRRDIASSDKLGYLVASCKGEALRMVKQYRATNTPFADVMAALEARFGRPDLLLKKAFDAIGNLDPGQHTAADARRLLDELKPLLVTIRANNVDPDQPALTAMLLTQIGPKIRGEIMSEWHRHCSAQGWVGATLPSMADFLTFADREVDALMAAQMSRGTQRRKEPPAGQKKPQQPAQRQPGTAMVGAGEGTGASSNKQGGRGRRSGGGGGGGGTAGAQGGRGKGAGGGLGGGVGGGKVAEKHLPACAFCRSDNHKPENCPDGKKLTPRERRRYLRTGCWRCLELGHMAKDCQKPKKPCGVPGCEADHHRILHGDFEGKKQ